jgi:hypothetical protein
MDKNYFNNVSLGCLYIIFGWYLCLNVSKPGTHSPGGYKYINNPHDQ